MMMTQHEFAKLLDIHTSTLCKWEKGITKPNKIYQRYINTLYIRSGIDIDITPSTIKAIRKNCGLTQKEFAKRLGVGEVTILDWEHGRHPPRPSAVKKIYEFYKSNI